MLIVCHALIGALDIRVKTIVEEGGCLLDAAEDSGDPDGSDDVPIRLPSG